MIISCVSSSPFLVYQVCPELSTPLLSKYCSCVPSAELRSGQSQGQKSNLCPTRTDGEANAKCSERHPPPTHTHTHIHTYRGTSQSLSFTSLDNIEGNPTGEGPIPSTLVNGYEKTAPQTDVEIKVPWIRIDTRPLQPLDVTSAAWYITVIPEN